MLPAAAPAFVDIGGCLLERVVTPDGSLMLNTTCPMSALSDIAARVETMEARMAARLETIEARMAAMEAAVTAQADVVLVPDPPPLSPPPGLPPSSPPSPPPPQNSQAHPAASCSSLAASGFGSGTFWVLATQAVEVYCDMTSFDLPAALVYRKMVNAGGCSTDGVCSDGNSAKSGSTPTPAMEWSVGVHKLSDADINALRTSDAHNNLMVRPMYGKSPWGHFELGKSYHKVRRHASPPAAVRRVVCDRSCSLRVPTACSLTRTHPIRPSAVDVRLLDAERLLDHQRGLRVRRDGPRATVDQLYLLDAPGHVALVSGHLALWVHLPADSHRLPLEWCIVGHAVARQPCLLLHAVRRKRLRAGGILRHLGPLRTCSTRAV